MSVKQPEAFAAVMEGTLDDVRGILAQGVNPNLFRGTKCLLIRALEHEDREQASARARLLLQAGATPTPTGHYSPISFVIHRQLWELLPLIHRLDPTALHTRIGDSGNLPAGMMAYFRQSEALKTLAALGVDIRRAEHHPVRNPAYTHTLHTWVAQAKSTPPEEEEAWKETANWLLELPFPPDEQSAAREGLLQTLDRAKTTPLLEWFRERFRKVPAWYPPSTARMEVGHWLDQMLVAKDSKDRNALWTKVKRRVEEGHIDLSPGMEDHGFQRPALQKLLELTAEHRQQPKLLAQAIERIRWAMDHGATVQDHYRGDWAWMGAMERADVPWAALKPLLEQGLDVRQLPDAPRQNGLTENEVKRLESMRGLTPAQRLVDTRQRSFEALIRACPDLINVRNQEGHTLLMQVATRNFKWESEPWRKDPKDVVLFLLDQGADPFAMDAKGNHFLQQLARNPSVEQQALEDVLVKVLNRFPTLLDQPNHANDTLREDLRLSFSDRPSLSPFYRSEGMDKALPSATTENRRKERF